MKRRHHDGPFDADRYYCPFPGCKRSFIELWRLKVHCKASPDIRGSGRERGHGLELTGCPRCYASLRSGTHHTTCIRSFLGVPSTNPTCFEPLVTYDSAGLATGAPRPTSPSDADDVKRYAGGNSTLPSFSAVFHSRSDSPAAADGDTISRRSGSAGTSVAVQEPQESRGSRIPPTKRPESADAIPTFSGGSWQIEAAAAAAAAAAIAASQPASTFSLGCNPTRLPNNLSYWQTNAAAAAAAAAKAISDASFASSSSPDMQPPPGAWSWADDAQHQTELMWRHANVPSRRSAPLAPGAYHLPAASAQQQSERMRHLAESQDLALAPPIPHEWQGQAPRADSSVDMNALARFSECGRGFTTAGGGSWPTPWMLDGGAWNPTTRGSLPTLPESETAASGLMGYGQQQPGARFESPFTVASIRHKAAASDGQPRQLPVTFNINDPPPWSYSANASTSTSSDAFRALSGGDSGDPEYMRSASLPVSLRSKRTAGGALHAWHPLSHNIGTIGLTAQGRRQWGAVGEGEVSGEEGGNTVPQRMHSLGGTPGVVTQGQRRAHSFSQASLPAGLFSGTHSGRELEDIGERVPGLHSFLYPGGMEVPQSNPAAESYSMESWGAVASRAPTGMEALQALWLQNEGADQRQSGGGGGGGGRGGSHHEGWGINLNSNTFIGKRTGGWLDLEDPAELQAAAARATQRPRLGSDGLEFPSERSQAKSSSVEPAFVHSPEGVKTETATLPNTSPILPTQFQPWPPTGPLIADPPANGSAEWNSSIAALEAPGATQPVPTENGTAGGTYRRVQSSTQGLAHSDSAMSWGWDLAPLDPDPDAIFPGEGICL